MHTTQPACAGVTAGQRVPYAQQPYSGGTPGLHSHHIGRHQRQGCGGGSPLNYRAAAQRGRDAHPRNAIVLSFRGRVHQCARPARTIEETTLSNLLIFDLDGVITSEEAYWDAAGLTLHELLYSPRYWGLYRQENQSQEGTRAAQAPPPPTSATPAPTEDAHDPLCRGGGGAEDGRGRLRRPCPPEPSDPSPYHYHPP